jgi:protein-tyrosine kinase
MSAFSNQTRKQDMEMQDSTSDVSLSQLLSRLHLDADSVHTVYEYMQSEGVGFVEAALHLRVVTQEQVDEALTLTQEQARAGKQGPERPSLIEAALRKSSPSRDMVLVQGEEVEPSPLLMLTHDDSDVRNEKIRALRTELLLLSEASREANCIVFLSASPSEGRSQLAAELAISFSQLGRRTLLVDADLRNPRQHLLFSCTNQSGLTDAIMNNQKPLYSSVKGLPFLSVLTSGTIRSNPVELLSDGRFEKLMREWRRTCDFVILDTPPIQSYADGIAVATLARKAVLVSRSRHTTFSATRNLLRRLATTQTQILGAVINHF